MVPDQTMIEQMVSMGYGLTVVKKALLAVKNESIPAAIDMIDQILTEEKKKKKVEIIRKAWSCPVCTFFNKSENETCEMCGELNDVVD
jgi:rubrerythrin